MRCCGCRCSSHRARGGRVALVARLRRSCCWVGRRRLRRGSGPAVLTATLAAIVAFGPITDGAAAQASCRRFQTARLIGATARPTATG